MNQYDAQDLDNTHTHDGDDWDNRNDLLSGPVWEILKRQISSMIQEHVEKSILGLQKELLSIRKKHEREQNELMEYLEKQFSLQSASDGNRLPSHVVAALDHLKKMKERLNVIEETIQIFHRDHEDKLQKQVKTHQEYESHNSALHENHLSSINQLLKDLEKIFLSQAAILSRLTRVENGHSPNATRVSLSDVDMDTRLGAIENVLANVVRDFEVLSGGHQNLVNRVCAVELMTDERHSILMSDLDVPRIPPLSLEIMASQSISVEEPLNDEDRLNVNSELRLMESDLKFIGERLESVKCIPVILFHYHGYLVYNMHMIRMKAGPQETVDSRHIYNDNVGASLIEISSPLALVSSLENTFFFSRGTFEGRTDDQPYSVIPSLPSAYVLFRLSQRRRASVDSAPVETMQVKPVVLDYKGSAPQTDSLKVRSLILIALLILAWVIRSYLLTYAAVDKPVMNDMMDFEIMLSRQARRNLEHQDL